MTEESKTTLFYMLALVGLIISSILFTGRMGSPLEESLPAPATPTFAKANSTLTLPKTDWKVCAFTTPKKTAFYRVKTSLLVNHALVITGVVYASDFVTPVPDILIEVWQAPAETLTPNPPETPGYPFYRWLHTDEAGHYKITILMPGQGNIPPLYYRVHYRNRCPLALQLFLVDESVLAEVSFASTLAKWGLPEVEPAGTLLQGPVDIVLPLPPPMP